ncbi:MAG: multiprotein bridging factor aMBF1 [Candidatus Thermoplasmatota archaeon]|nr:multiprotein bridging factor aMBF1 [Candidatus Thermoplasmatota archaeon]
MECELCGKVDKNLVRVVIEGSLLSVCQKCAKFGTASAAIQPKITSAELAERLEKRKKFLEEKNIFAEIGYELVDDYGERIRKARLKAGLTPEQLGKLINERRTVITKLEARVMTPDDELIRKLEKALDIKLRVKQ